MSENADALYKFIEDPSTLYNTFLEESKKQIQERKINEEVEREERRVKRKNKPQSDAPVNTDYSFYIKQFKEKGKKKAEDNTKDGKEVEELTDKLTTDFYNELFAGLIVFKFSMHVKSVLKKAYENDKYSVTANTLNMCLTHWCSYISSRLVYKEVEIYSISDQYPSASFRDMNSLSSYAQLLVGDVLQNTPVPRTRSKSRVSKQVPTLINIDKKDSGVILKIAQHWFLSRKHPQIEKLFEKDKQIAAVWQMVASVQNQRLLGLQVPFSHELEEETHLDEQPTQAISFSHDVEIVKAKEPIRAFCIDQNNPSLLAYATSKIIREVNITHSIKYRKRNPMLDKIQDEECLTWEASLHRFDEIAVRDDSMSAQPGAVLPSNAGFGLYDFITQRENDESVDTNAGDNNALTRIKKRLTLARKPSFNSSSVSQFKHQQTSSLSLKKKTGGVDHNQSVTTLISHPYLPFYLSGGVDGAIHMFQFGTPTALRTYREQGPSITSLRFSRFGYKFGATDVNGYLTLYRFEAAKESIQTFSQLHCHGKANGFTFLDSASVVATVGVTGNAKTLTIWDLLMPVYDANVHTTSFTDEPSCVLYCSRYNTVMVGTKRGDISVIDIRTKNPIKTFTAHSGSVIETMSLDVTEDFFTSGCSDGDVKIWDMRSLDNIQMFRQAHRREQMFNLGPSGVTDMTITSQFFYSAGSDGRIIRRTIL